MIEKKAREIVEELKITNEFRVLKQAKDNLERNSKLKKRVDQFFQDNAEVYERSDYAGKAQKEEFKRKFDEMMRIPEIAAYFNAGQKFDYAVIQLHQLIDRLIEQTLEESRI